MNRSLFFHLTEILLIFAFLMAFPCHAPGSEFELFDESSGLPSSFITSIESCTEGVWVGTWRGLAFLTRSNSSASGSVKPLFRAFSTGDGLPSPHVTSLACSPEKGIWVGFSFSGDSGLAYYDGEKFSVYEKIGDFHPRNVTALKTAGDALWIGTWGNGVARYDFKTGKVNIFTTRDGLVDDYITSIEHLGNLVFFGSKYKKGLAVWNGENFKIYNEETSGLVNNNVYSLAVDQKSSVLWIGTWGGVNEFAPFEDKWKSHLALGKGKLIKNFARRVLVDRSGNIWFGTDDGLSVYSPQKNSWKSFGVADGLPSGQITALGDDTVYVWIGTDRGLARIAREKING